jgi:uncharacterized repeat protein (TIGR01451 family)
MATNAAGVATAGPFSVTVSTPNNSPDADVSAALSCPASVQVKGIGTCTLTVANAGPATAQFVTVGLTLPHGFTRVSSSAGAMWFGHDAMWSLGTLPSGASVVLTVSFEPRTTGSPALDALAISANLDPSYANNVAMATVSITS